MGRLVISVVTLSSGVALTARSIDPRVGLGWTWSAVGFVAGLVICAAGVFLLVRGVARRSSWRLRVSAHSMGGAAERRRGMDSGGLFAAPFRSWGSEFGGGVRMSSGGELREAARALLFSCDEDPHKTARTRRALRAACRRTHTRAVAHLQPERRRVRPRARLFM